MPQEVCHNIGVARMDTPASCVGERFPGFSREFPPSWRYNGTGFPMRESLAVVCRKEPLLHLPLLREEWP